ncbi:MAG: hypothetical protein WBD99_03785 [Thermodesulfobacteriota bacterium]
MPLKGHSRMLLSGIQIVIVLRCTCTESIEVLSIGSTVALSWLTLDELGYSDENKEKDKKDEAMTEKLQG